MGIKKRLFSSFVKPFNYLANRYDYEVVVQKKCSDVVRTHYMLYDKTEKNGLVQEYEKYYDYCRYRTFELLVEDIKNIYTPEQLCAFSVAEAGVFEGDFAWIINRYFSDCKLFLYDTFEGFDKNDVAQELSKGYTDNEYMNEIEDYFGKNAKSSDEKIKEIYRKMINPDACVIRKGYFPESIGDEANNQWIFVSLDMDLYKPIKEGILFFWPRLVKGGVIMIHDYNNIGFNGIKDAVKEAEEKFGVIPKVPIPDQGGTIILRKI